MLVHLGGQADHQGPWASCVFQLIMDHMRGNNLNHISWKCSPDSFLNLHGFFGFHGFFCHIFLFSLIWDMWEGVKVSKTSCEVEISSNPPNLCILLGRVSTHESKRTVKFKILFYFVFLGKFILFWIFSMVINGNYKIYDILKMDGSSLGLEQ